VAVADKASALVNAVRIAGRGMLADLLDWVLERSRTAGASSGVSTIRVSVSGVHNPIGPCRLRPDLVVGTVLSDG
jgi:hypothetical protein